MFKRNEKPLTKEQLHRNIALTTAVVIIIEAIFITLIIIQKKISMIWAPCVVLVFYGFTLFFDLGRLHDLDEEKSQSDDDDTIELKEIKEEEK